VPFDDVYDQLGVFPVFILRLADIKRTAADFPKINVAGADGEITGQIAVGCAVIAAASGLAGMSLPQRE
jgi:hypothetical protein